MLYNDDYREPDHIRGIKGVLYEYYVEVYALENFIILIRLEHKTIYIQ